MGKSAKAFKRPTKKQKETKKTEKAALKSASKAAADQQSTAAAGAAAGRSSVPKALAKTAGGGISKQKAKAPSTKLKAKIAAGKKTKQPRKDYMALFSK